MPNNEEDRIERLKRELYRPSEAPAQVRRSALSSVERSDSVAWPAMETAGSSSRRKRFSLLSIIFFSSLIFFLAAVGMTAYIFSRGGNLISPANVELIVAGPETVKAGDTLTVQVLIANRNAAALKSVDLIAEYPDGTRSPIDLAKTLTRSRWSLGTINADAAANQTIKAVVFGEKETEQELRLTIEYRLADSNAIFDKTDSYRYRISDSPVTLTADWPSEVNASQPLSLTFEVAANAAIAIKGLIVKADYPPGFIYKKATPAPSFGNNFWRLGELAVGARRQITVTGTLEGERETVKSFRLAAGSAKVGFDDELDLVYGELVKAITIKRPYIDLVFALNGQAASGDQVASSEELLRADITWMNNLPTEVLDGKIEVTIKSQILDERRVSVSDGFYQSSNGLIVWQRGTKSDLARLAPGASGQASFTFATKSLVGSGQTAIQNPNLNLTIRFTGRRISEGLPDEAIESSLSRLIKINSVFQLAAGAVYHDGPFTNTGPLPPRTGQTTTYTIIWSVINSSNNVKNATVKATLPTYIRWLDAVLPTVEKVSFNQATGEVIWDLGMVEAGRGLARAAREVAFQIAFQPSASQIDQTPALITAPTLSGVDAYTGQVLNYARRALDTRLLNDPQFRPGDERVVN